MALARPSFEIVHFDEIEQLTQFAVKSNAAAWAKREMKPSVDQKIVRRILGPTHENVARGVYEKLIRGNELLGFYGIYVEKHSNSRCLLDSLFVKANLDRRGWGKKLFMRALEKARTMGCREMEWQSDPFAKEFYIKMQAKIEGEDPCPLVDRERDPEHADLKAPRFRIEL